MSQKIWADLLSKGKFIELASDVNSSQLGYYYFQFAPEFQKLNRLIREYDTDGIPLNNSYIDVPDGKPHYYPISIGQVALAIFHRYLSQKNESDKIHFLKIADWFMINKLEDDSGTYWLTDVPKPEYQVFTPWKSAFTQSRALSVLLRAWQLTGNVSYLDTASGALQPFKFDILAGGVAVRRSNEPVFYEEYVAAYPTRVLDGHIFALFGLFDYVRVVSDKTPLSSGSEGILARDLFEEGCRGLLTILPDYDTGHWLLFNRCEVPGYPTYDPCTIHYMQLIIRQLEVLTKIYPHSDWEQYIRRFQSYLNWPNILRMYKNKFQSLKKLNRL